MFRLSKVFAAFALIVVALVFGSLPMNHVSAQQDNKATVTAIFTAYNAAIKSGDTKALEAFLAPDYKDLDAPEGTNGVDYLKSLVALNNVAAPDAQYEVKTMVAEGDKVAVYNVFSGTNTGKIGEMDPTNKKFTVKSIDIFTFKDGKVVEHISATDTASFYQQLGFTLQPAAAAQ
jgi:predicted ester cyclase